MAKSLNDTSMLAMALVGYEIERQKIDEKIREIRMQLGAGGTSSGSGAAKKTAVVGAKKRVLSAAARKRIAVAQKKRWAEHRRKLAAAKSE